MRKLGSFRNDRRGIVQVLVVGGVCLIIAGLFWIVMTMPVSTVTTSLGLTFRDDAANTVSFIDFFIGAMPIAAGVICVGWGFTRTIEERETGISSL